MLTSSLRNLYAQDKIRAALEAISKKPTARPQELSLADFSSLYEELHRH